MSDISFYMVLRGQNACFELDENPYIPFKNNTNDFIESLEFVAKAPYSKFFQLYFSLDSGYRDRANQVSICILQELFEHMKGWKERDWVLREVRD